MEKYRIGFSEDIHQFKQGRKLVLGGVEIPNETGLDGHSDADVVVHVVAESILGALALGDLGTFFPEYDIQYEGIYSVLLLKQVVMEMDSAGYEINNIDIQVAAKKPRLSSWIPKMKTKLASTLKTEERKISIKAMTYNLVDSVGQGKAIKASAIVLLKRKKVFVK